MWGDYSNTNLPISVPAWDGGIFHGSYVSKNNNEDMP